jgi:hypothetical protein
MASMPTEEAEAHIDARQLADALVRVCINTPGAFICARAEELGSEEELGEVYY